MTNTENSDTEKPGFLNLLIIVLSIYLCAAGIIDRYIF